MKSVKFTILIFSLFSLIFAFILFSDSFAQGIGDSIWKPPQNLSNTPDKCSVNADIAADKYGRVHAVWAGCSAIYTPGQGISPDTIYYSVLDNTNWSQPVDIIFKPAGGSAGGPSILIDQDDVIHLSFIGETGYVEGNLLYTQSHITTANTAKDWKDPLKIASSVNYSDFASDGQGCVHLVYGTANPAGIWHTSSCDQGFSWSLSNEINTINNSTLAVYPRVSIDDSDRIHVVWTEITSNKNYVGAVYYAHSMDHGTTWSVMTVDPPSSMQYSENYGPSFINVASVGSNQVHLVWDGAPGGQRWHQWSHDGGINWSFPKQLDPDLRALTWPNALAVDSSGVLHLFTLGHEWNKGGDYGGLYHASWQDRQWSRFELVDPRGELDFHLVNAAISGGNQFHVIYQNNKSSQDIKLFDIWYTSGSSTSAPSEEPSQLIIEPTQILPNSTEEISEPQAAVPQTNLPAEIANIPVLPKSNSQFPIFAGIIPVLVIIIVLIVRRQYFS